METLRSGWPRRAGYAAGAWSLIGVGFALSWTAGGGSGYPLDGVAGGRVAAWAAAAVFAAGGVAGVASMRDGRVPRRPTLGALWAACGVAAAGTFGFVMSALQLLFTGSVDDWAVFGVEVVAAVGAALFAGAALAFGRRTAGTCPRCGIVHADAGAGRSAAAAGGSAEGAGPTGAGDASPRVRRVAWAGALAFVPYIVMKTTWALGGTFAGVPSEEVVAEFERNGASGLILTMERYGLDFTTLSALAGILLLMGLTHRWGLVFPRWPPPLAGRRVPRWLPLVPAWLGALTLAPYGVVAGVGYLLPAALGLTDMPDIGLATGWSAWTIAACGIGAFGPFGVALGVAAWSYQRRTRPLCVSPGSRVGGAPCAP